MPWMESDVDDLIELVEAYCEKTDCLECLLTPSGKYKPCLKEIAYSLRIDYNSIRDIATKFIKGIECYVTSDF